MTFYWSAIVNIALSGTVFELFDVEWYHDLEIWVRGHSRSLKLVLHKNLGAILYLPSILTMALSCIICEILVENRDFLIPPCIRRPRYEGPRRIISIPFGVEKLRWWSYPTVEKFWGYVIPFRYNTGVWRTDRRTDRQTSCHGIVRAMHTRHAVKTV